MARRPPSDRRKPPASPIPEWEQGYGMTLADVTRYRVGRPPSASVILARRQAEADRANGGTPLTSLRLHGTRLDVNGRALLLLTLARHDGGWRMVAVDGASGATREMWSASISRQAASRRHYSAVAQLQAKTGARVIATRGVVQPRVAPPPDELPIVGSTLWYALALRLAHDGERDDYVGQVARLVLGLLENGDHGQVIVEMLDAARVDHAPLADTAGAWLRLLGYDAVHAYVPEGPDAAYASQLLHYDAELLSH